MLEHSRQAFLDHFKPMPRILHWFLRFSILNPICIRLIGAASRRNRDLLIRSFYLGVLAAVLFFGLMAITATGRLSLRELAAGSANVFIILAILQFILICVLTPLFMASAISKEAEPQTWDVLLTTPMSPTQIVLGNLFGRLFFIIALSVAALPLMVVTQFFGGVPLETILLTQVVAICLAILIAALAIAISVTRTAGRKAAVGFFVITIVVLATTFGVDNFIREQVRGGQLNYYTTVLTPFNPFLVLETILAPSNYVIPESSSSPQPLAWMVTHPVQGWCWFTLLTSTILVVWSSLKVRTLGVKHAGQSKFAQLMAPTASQHKAVSGNPIAWRERVTRHRNLGSLLVRWGFLAVSLLTCIIMTTLFLTIMIQPSTYRDSMTIIVITEMLIVLFAAITLSASAIAKEREDGTLDLLLTTAMTPKMYLYGKVKGLVLHLLPMVLAPCLTMMTIGVVVLATPNIAIVPDTLPNDYETVVPLAVYGGAFTMPFLFIPFVAFCIAIGLMWSLRSKGSISAIVTTLTLITIITFGLGLCVMPLSSTLYASAFFNALSPISQLFSTMHGATTIPKIIAQGDKSANAGLAVCSLVGGLLWSTICWGLLKSMTASFVMTVRRLAGQR